MRCADDEAVNEVASSLVPPMAGGESDDAPQPQKTARRDAQQLSADLEVLEIPSDAPPDHDAVVQIEREAHALGETELEMRARLQSAKGVSETATGAVLVWEVNEWAAKHGNRGLLAESHRLLAWFSYLLGDPAAVLDHAVRAVELLDETTTPRIRVQRVGTLATALGQVGLYDAARQRFEEVEEILASEGVSDGSGLILRMCTLNNLAVNEHQAGNHERAWKVAQRMLAVAAGEAHPLDASDIHTVALCQMGLGRYVDAARTIQECLDAFDPHEGVNPDALAHLLLTLAEIQRHMGETDRAQTTLQRCRAACDELGLHWARMLAQQEQAELYAAIGESQLAFQTYKEFYAETEAQHSLERAAQARMRQALLETTEARQQAQEFREQARRDPLTGMRNRRFVDEELPALLSRAADSGTPLSLAVVDVDKLKSINDLLSHDVGDQVLVVVATLIATSIATLIHTSIAGPAATAVPARDEASFVARMGGDEFLIVLPGLDPDRASRHWEDVRATIASHHWEPITGGNEVTVSIGGATTRSGDSHTAVLGRADQNLYAAKHAGRNRVGNRTTTHHD